LRPTTPQATQPAARMAVETVAREFLTAARKGDMDRVRALSVGSVEGWRTREELMRLRLPETPVGWVPETPVGWLKDPRVYVSELQREVLIAHPPKRIHIQRTLVKGSFAIVQIPAGVNQGAVIVLKRTQQGWRVATLDELQKPLERQFQRHAAQLALVKPRKQPTTQPRDADAKVPWSKVVNGLQCRLLVVRRQPTGVWRVVNGTMREVTMPMDHPVLELRNVSKQPIYVPLYDDGLPVVDIAIKDHPELRSPTSYGEAYPAPHLLKPGEVLRRQLSGNVGGNYLIAYGQRKPGAGWIRFDPGGKGINVSRVVRELGGESVAMGFAPGGLGRYIEQTLKAEGIQCDFIHTKGETRTNITIMDESRHVHTILSDPGPQTDDRFAEQLLSKLRKRLHANDWLVVAGSIPPPLSPGIYAEIITMARENWVHTVLDADGPALVVGVAARPEMVKGNRRELERLLDCRLSDERSTLEAAGVLRGKDIRMAVVTRGREGAIAVCDEGAWRGVAPRVRAVSAVGSGDAFLAGVVLTLSGGGTMEEALRLGVAAGTACVLTPGTELCHRREVDLLQPRVKVRRIEPEPSPAQGA
ncbi:hypothetical protein LCGC14_1838270, partial [marine sediment metagenome]